MNQFTETLPNQVALKMMIVPTGNFLMGTLSLDRNHPKDEKPCNKVYLISFAIGKYPVTQEQYQEVMGVNPSHFQGNPQNPVENVSWDDAIVFCKKLSEMTGKKYRLPTESEWEYACRAGTATRYYFGDDENQLGDYAWYYDNSQGTTHPVGQKLPNTWGLYDMHGNVHEWCEEVVIRGGSWGSYPAFCRSAFRFNLFRRVYRIFNNGFRVVCDN